METYFEDLIWVGIGIFAIGFFLFVMGLGSEHNQRIEVEKYCKLHDCKEFVAPDITG